jgi:hypothetical protein
MVIPSAKLEILPPVHWAAFKNSLAVAKLLIEAKADVNAKADNGMTPLLIASLYNFLDMARLLIDAKADVNAKSNMGNTPLQIAIKRNFLDLANLLRQASNKRNIVLPAPPPNPPPQKNGTTRVPGLPGDTKAETYHSFWQEYAGMRLERGTVVSYSWPSPEKALIVILEVRKGRQFAGQLNTTEVPARASGDVVMYGKVTAVLNLLIARKSGVVWTQYTQERTPRIILCRLFVSGFNNFEPQRWTHRLPVKKELNPCGLPRWWPEGDFPPGEGETYYHMGLFQPDASRDHFDETDPQDGLPFDTWLGY